MIVCIICLRFRWYSEKYDWFYLDGSANVYALHVSLTAAGDAKDPINTSSPANGKQFLVRLSAVLYVPPLMTHGGSLRHQCVAIRASLAV
jgi:hypothetical protein